jgi:hypothetical protein
MPWGTWAFGSSGWSLVDLLARGSSGLLMCGYCLVIGTEGSVAPPVRMLAWAPAGQLESKMC